MLRLKKGRLLGFLRRNTLETALNSVRMAKTQAKSGGVRSFTSETHEGDGWLSCLAGSLLAGHGRLFLLRGVAGFGLFLRGFLLRGLGGFIAHNFLSN